METGKKTSRILADSGIASMNLRQKQNCVLHLHFVVGRRPVSDNKSYAGVIFLPNTLPTNNLLMNLYGTALIRYLVSTEVS